MKDGAPGGYFPGRFQGCFRSSACALPRSSPARIRLVDGSGKQGRQPPDSTEPGAGLVHNASRPSTCTQVPIGTLEEVPPGMGELPTPAIGLQAESERGRLHRQSQTNCRTGTAGRPRHRGSSAFNFLAGIVLNRGFQFDGRRLARSTNPPGTLHAWPRRSRRSS